MENAQELSSWSLAQEQRHLTRTRISQAAMEVVARRGFGATVEEIAQVSGVSPRTIFRHYASHDQLIVATVKDMFEACGGPTNKLDDDVDEWLEDLLMIVHSRNAEIVGDAFWDIHAPNPNTSAVLAEIDALRHKNRVRGVRYLVAVAWKAAGGRDEPPEALALAFALNFSVFTTQALMVDFDQTPARIGALAADIVKLLLHRAVAAQSSGHLGSAVGDGSEG